MSLGRGAATQTSANTLEEAATRDGTERRPRSPSPGLECGPQRSTLVSCHPEKQPSLPLVQGRRILQDPGALPRSCRGADPTRLLRSLCGHCTVRTEDLGPPVDSLVTSWGHCTKQGEPLDEEAPADRGTMNRRVLSCHTAVSEVRASDESGLACGLACGTTQRHEYSGSEQLTTVIVMKRSVNEAHTPFWSWSLWLWAPFP
ncbi:uncharacterized protein LOC117285738 [Fukomys damarensis]|uniref:uncharacterized protein LOC117285738 n=1 Tax=Fukomys damarensis TaxID=885580 RepID=UPI001455BC13|nr:uncharacterized protein LOC117285738 [Fukomys damarensis]